MLPKLRNYEFLKVQTYHLVWEGGLVASGKAGFLKISLVGNIIFFIELTFAEIIKLLIPLYSFKSVSAVILKRKPGRFNYNYCDYSHIPEGQLRYTDVRWLVKVV